MRYQYNLTEQTISEGLALRLVRYAERELAANGFLAAVQGWSVTVGTDNGDLTPANRNYWVTWTNDQGGAISLVGISTSKGWPTLDHGLSIQRA